MDKIDIRDLRVGNWIYHKDCPIPLQVSGVKDNEVYLKHSFEHNRTIGFMRQDRPSACNIDEIKPIPLENEILKKNFKRYDMDFEISDNLYISWNKSKEGYKLFTLDNLDNNIHLVYLNYVHQLQNLLRDFGIDKEIII